MKRIKWGRLPRKPHKPRPRLSFAAWCRSALPTETWWSERGPQSFQADAKRHGATVETAVFHAIHVTGPREVETVCLTRVTMIGRDNEQQLKEGSQHAPHHQ